MKPTDSKVKTFVLVLLLIQAGNAAILNGQTIEPVRSGSYLQDVMTEISLPADAGKNVIRLFKTGNDLTAVTSKGVFRYRNSQWTGSSDGSGWLTASTDKQGNIWLASALSVKKNGDAKEIPLPAGYTNDTILSLFPEDDKTVLVGTINGLVSYNGKWNTIPFTKGKRINSITRDSKGDIWLATNDGLLRKMSGTWVNMDDLLMAYGLKRTYFTLESLDDKGEILFGGLFGAGCIAENGDHWILRGADGMPYGPVRTISAANNILWFGTDRGAIKKDNGWHYYNGKRWLPDNKVNDILLIDGQTTWIATPNGISQIRQISMKLEDKTVSFEERISKRHDRYGLVSESMLKSPGNLSNSRTVTNDNDGLWTSIYLAAECFRYSVTKDPLAKKNAEKAFAAMERLETITGIPGFPARSYVAVNESTGQGGEWHLSKDGKWKWKGDTSSDEIVGHMFAYPLFYDLVAEGEMKTRARNLVDRIMTYITDNNFNLIDLDGKPTRWGVWCPDSLNSATDWIYEKGINSLQILAFLKAGYHVTGNQKYEKAYNILIKEHHYAENMIRQKMYGPFDINHSDDELAFLPYYTLFRYAKEPDLIPLYTRSIQRSWNAERQDRIPLWNIIASVALKKNCDLNIAIEELQQIPMDMITWRMENSHRWDLPADQLTDRFGKLQAVRPVATPERGISKWNSNTYLFDSGTGGYTEDDGAYFLLPYWMARYHHLLVEDR